MTKASLYNHSINLITLVQVRKLGAGSVAPQQACRTLENGIYPIMRISRACWIVFIFLVACKKEHPTNENSLSVPSASGEYRGRYRGGIETFQLSTNGTFIQKFCRMDGTVVYDNNGTWSIGTKSVVFFRPFVGNTSPSVTDTEKFEKTDSGMAIFKSDPVRLEFGEWPYCASKTTSAKP